MQKNPLVLEKCISFLKTENIPAQDLLKMYQKVIEKHVHNEHFEEALAKLKEALNFTCIDNISNDFIDRIKRGLAAQGKTFSID